MTFFRGIRLPFFLWLAFVVGTLAAMASAKLGRPEIRGDGARGKTIYESRCIGCHSLDQNRVGPKHRGVYGRAAGAVPDYAYSQALKNSNLVWGADTLDKWLAGPVELVPGTTMGFVLPDPSDRADVIDYLKSISTQDDPTIGFKFPRLRRRCEGDDSAEEGCADGATIEFIELRTTQLVNATTPA